ncbi:class I SAM-dependent methyltransferase [Penaeicola halotolerans]|uniref:class I SAM-dependent methyltransferase n=1 Tax=Penaeicola halotolerans TaxID=2793196 RepID=UPI001CF8A175|nr:class I SAM-dependent methyltransferase [Penaeicola halotolerans]
MWGKLFNQLGRDYRDKFLKKINKLERPFMKNKELDIILEVITKKQPKRSLEWGSGFSTLWFPSLIEKRDLWLALEHEEDWAKLIQSKNTDDKVRIDYVASEIPGWNNKEDYKKDGTYEEFKSYVEYPEQFAPFDFVMIDGRARIDCLKKAFDIVNDDAIIIFHDCNRPHYHKYQDLFKYGVFITDHRKSHGGMWIGSKATPIEEVLDVAYHQELWRRHTKLALAFKF